MRLDGQTHQQDIAALLKEESSYAEEFLTRLAAARLILFSEYPVQIRVTSHTPAEPVKSRTVEWSQFGQLRIRVTQAEGLVRFLAALPLAKNIFFHLAALWIALLGVVVSVRLLQLESFSTQARSFVLHPTQIALLILLLFVTTALHELGHAVCCGVFGVPVRSMGIMIYYLQPAAFADITDSWRLKNKWHRVLICLSGIYVQAVINAAAAFFLLGLHLSGRRSTLLLLYIAMNLAMIAFNLLPFVRLDGYWILSAILALPNLLDRAREWLRARVLSALTRKPVNEKALRYSAVLHMSPLSRSLLTSYAMSAQVFSVAMWAGGLAFLFRVTRWFGVPATGSYFAVGGLVLCGVCIFIFRTRKAASQSPLPAATTAPLPHSIDPVRSIRLNPFATVADDQKGTLVFAWTSSDQFAVPRTPQLVSLLPKLRHACTLEDIENGHGSLDSQTKAILYRLWQLKHLRYSSEWEIEEEYSRYSRQLGWFTFNMAARGMEKQVLSNLMDKTVVVLGVGGVGSNVALNLAACGIGSLHLVDGDTVEISNLNRQLLYTPADIKRHKVDVAADRLRLFNPSLRIRQTQTFLRSIEDVLRVIEGADFVVRAIDTPVEAQLWVNQACIEAGIPSIGAGFLMQGALVGPTVIPGQTACLACHQQQLPQLDRGVGVTLAPVVTTAAGILANEVVSYLAGLGTLRTTEGVLQINAPTFAITLHPVTKDPNCLVCGQLKETMA